MRRLVAATLTLIALVGCVASEGDVSDRIRIGYFPNVTHAPAIVGLDEGVFARHLGPGVTIETKTFNAGGQAVEALFSNAIDIAYVGPNPAVNAWSRSKGAAVRVIAGSTSGGASLVVRSQIRSVADLAGTTLSSPALGNTQDVALRAWLVEQGFETDAEGGGDVSIRPQENAQILETFRSGEIDGAWIPEPWATRLVDEAQARVLVDERDLWPDGRFATTVVVARTSFLREQPDMLERFLRGHVEAVGIANEDAERSQGVVIRSIGGSTGARLDPGTIARAWRNLSFTVDPIEASLVRSAKDAVEVGLLEPIDLDGLVDVATLNGVLGGAGLRQVRS